MSNLPPTAGLAPLDTAAALRLALRRLAKAVTIITCKQDGRRFAMPATAVSELSMDPPSMLVCVNRTASLHQPLSDGASFAINILRSDQQAIVVHCTSGAKGEERFDLGDWQEEAGVPILADAQAAIVCDHATAQDFGTHTIFIGEVRFVATSGAPEPLVYADGQFGAMLWPEAHNNSV